MEPYYIGIDLGTGSTKAIAYTVKGESLASAQFHYSLSSPRIGYFELEPEQVWQGVLYCMNSLKKKLPGKASGIGLSAAMHGLTLVSLEGEVLYSIITWADTRSKAIALRLKNLPWAEDLYQKTGTPIHAMSPLCKIIWLKENLPELFIKPIKILSIKSFIWFKLFGVFEEDWSLGSATGMMNILSRAWFSDALQLAGIELSQLPQLVSTTFFRGDLVSDRALKNGFEMGIPITIGASDGCTACLGSYTLSAGTASITIGTSGAVRICSKKPVYDYSSMIFNYILDDQYWVSGGAINNGGLALDWAILNYMPKKVKNPYKECFERINETPMGAEGLLFLPYLTGERAPIWDGQASAAFLGIKLHHTSSHFLRAVLEGINFAIYEVLQRLESKTTLQNRIHISGGFTESAVWIQTLANITGKTLVLLKREDASTLGAVFLAMKATGNLDSLDNLPKSLVFREYIPNMEAFALYQKIFAIYIGIYPSLVNSLLSLSHITHPTP